MPIFRNSQNSFRVSFTIYVCHSINVLKIVSCLKKYMSVSKIPNYNVSRTKNCSFRLPLQLPVVELCALDDHEVRREVDAPSERRRADEHLPCSVDRALTLAAHCRVSSEWLDHIFGSLPFSPLFRWADYSSLAPNATPQRGWVAPFPPSPDRLGCEKAFLNETSSR